MKAGLGFRPARRGPEFDFRVRPSPIRTAPGTENMQENTEWK
jgi:hypothetical protein